MTQHLGTLTPPRTHADPVRGYRAVTVAWTAALAGVGAALQAAWVDAPLLERGRYLEVWVGLALVGVASLTLAVGRRFLHARSRSEQHGLLRTLFTLAPSFAAAAVITATLAARGDEAFGLLPGLWMLCYSLAIYASLPRLPRGVGAIGCFYFAAGAVTLGLPAELALAPWSMGAVFAAGQLWAAWLLARNPEGCEFPAGRR